MGAHGLPLMKKGDWNDALDRIGHKGKGESVWLAFFLYGILDKFASLAEKKGDAEAAALYREEAAKLKENIKKHAWKDDEAYFIRAFADDGDPVLLNDVIVAAWSVMSGGADDETAKRAVRAAFERLYDPETKMVRLYSGSVPAEISGGFGA